MSSQKISIIIPVYNEKDNLIPLCQELVKILDNIVQDYEIILVNDGSTDGTAVVLQQIATQNHQIKIVEFSRNFGQTAALAAGIKLATSEIIITIDADLENDPADIPKLLAKFNHGYDIVSGWRQKRWQNKKISRQLASWMANWLISAVTKTKLHDHGCTLKVYQADILKNIQLYGEMHRFISAIAAWQGARITELPVNHRPRRFGQSKYGISRTGKVLLDLLTVKFFSNYATKPIHFFGKVGYYLLFLSLLAGIWALILKFVRGTSLISTPLPLLTVFLVLVAVQFVSMGLLAEILVRTYYESQQKTTYLIKKKTNFND